MIQFTLKDVRSDIFTKKKINFTDQITFQKNNKFISNDNKIHE